MPRKLLRGYILPLTIFPTLTALAFNLTFGRLKSTGLEVKLGARCRHNFDPSSTPDAYLPPYTGFSPIDETLCPLIAFFHILMKSPLPLSFLTYAIGISAPLVLLPNLEAYRTGQHRLLCYPIIWGLLTQVMTVGATFPLYWLTFILTGGVKKSRSLTANSFTQAGAEAIIFGIIVGAVIPSVAMLILDDPSIIALWQPYPAYVSIAQILHLQIRTVSKHSDSGYKTIQALYLGCFIVSSSVHISTVWPMRNDFSGLKALLLPSISVLDPTTDIALHLLDFLKWDILLAYTSTALAMLWFAQSVKQLFAILLWCTVAIPLFGFGAAVMGVTIWKDGLLIY